MYEVVICTEFSAAHALRNKDGVCEPLHGHNWRIEVYVRGNQLDEYGTLVDFSQLKSLTDQVVQRLDHQFLNNLAPFDNTNPSSENIARHVLESVGSRINNEWRRVHKVYAWESSNAGASYQVDIESS
jgi:6-pyruvoyltetrahydropterin/6-carboxytetrahydropterin synthase